ncbi:MAG: hypothetical protein AB1414_08800 [bacterium]
MKFKYFKYIGVYGIALILLFLGWESEISAFGISITPASINRSVSEDDHIIPLTIENPGSETVEYFVYASSLGQKLDGEAISLDDIDAPFSLVRWIKFNPAKFKLADGESKIVEADIQIPKDSGGGLYGIIYVEARLLIPSGEHVASIPRVGAITLLTLPGEAIKEAEITSVDIIQNKQGEEIHILSTFHNTGNIYLRPEGYVIIRNQAGEKIDKVFIKPVKILPTYSRQLIAKWKPENLLTGTYTAEVNMTFASKSLIAKKTFEVINTNEIAILKGEIASFEEIKAVQHKPLSFKLLFHNSGNVNLSIGGEIEVKDFENEIIERVPIKINEVIAHGSKEVTTVLSKGLPIGTYTATAKIKYSDEKIVTATTNINVIEKEIIQAGEIIELTVPKVNAGNVLILPKLLFRNTGNVPLQVEGMIELENSQGMTIGQIIIDMKPIEIDVTERLGTSWQGELPAGLYKAVATLIFGDGKMITKTSPFLVIGNW